MTYQTHQVKPGPPPLVRGWRTSCQPLNLQSNQWNILRPSLLQTERHLPLSRTFWLLSWPCKHNFAINNIYTHVHLLNYKKKNNNHNIRSSKSSFMNPYPKKKSSFLVFIKGSTSKKQLIWMKTITHHSLQQTEWSTNKKQHMKSGALGTEPVGEFCAANHSTSFTERVL